MGNDSGYGAKFCGPCAEGVVLCFTPQLPVAQENAMRLSLLNCSNSPLALPKLKNALCAALGELGIVHAQPAKIGVSYRLAARLSHKNAQSAIEAQRRGTE